MAGNDKKEPTYEDKLKEAQKNLIALGYAKDMGGSFDASNSPGITDMNKVKIAMEKFRHDNDLGKQSYAETFTTIKIAADAQVAAAKAAAGPQAAKAPETKAPATAAPAAAVKSLSTDELKQQEANAYLRVLGKTYDQFRAENALNNGADLAGKGATSPEAIAALKAKVTGSPEAQAFARSMLEKDATQDRKSNVELKGNDVIALQYMLKANGQNIGAFAHDGQPGVKDGIDGTLGKMTREAAETVASPSFNKKGPEVTAPSSPASNAPTSQGNSGASAQPPQAQTQVTQQQQPMVQAPPAPQVVYVQAPQGYTIGQRGTVAPYFRQEAGYREGPAYPYARPISPIEYRDMQRERIYARQDGMMAHREQQQGYNEISRGVGALTDRNRYNDGQGVGALLNGALRIFDPAGQQNPRGPRF